MSETDLFVGIDPGQMTRLVWKRGHGLLRLAQSAHPQKEMEVSV